MNPYGCASALHQNKFILILISMNYAQARLKDRCLYSMNNADDGHMSVDNASKQY